MLPLCEFHWQIAAIEFLIRGLFDQKLVSNLTTGTPTETNLPNNTSCGAALQRSTKIAQAHSWRGRLQQHRLLYRTRHKTVLLLQHQVINVTIRKQLQICALLTSFTEQ